jgi:hypothetical protein
MPAGDEGNSELHTVTPNSNEDRLGPEERTVCRPIPAAGIVILSEALHAESKPAGCPILNVAPFATFRMGFSI